MRIAILTGDNREAYKDYSHPTPYFGTAPEALLQGFTALGQEVEVHVVSCLQEPAPSPEKIADNIWYHGLHVPKFGWLRTAYQGCVRATRKKLQEIRPDIVHGQGMERDCSLAAIFSGFPNVLTIHGNMRLVARLSKARPFSYLWLTAWLEGFTIPRSGGVVCITNYTREAVKDLAKRTWVLPNGVNWNFFECRPAPVDPPVCLCIGTIGMRKNQNAFIRALDPLAAKRKFKVIFLGSPDVGSAYSAEFMELVRSRPWCEFAGFANGYEKLKPYYEKASLLALPTLEDNCPMVVLEAMAAGVPVVAANVGGVPDLVQDGKNGLMCDSQSAESMSGAVEKILAEPEAARAMAAQARRDALERFHPAAVARKHLEIYRSVLGINQSPGSS
jgi:glycosyltransferase involved in cell wall biosynthesis